MTVERGKGRELVELYISDLWNLNLMVGTLIQFGLFLNF